MNRIGVDESGKGDYFGYLVVAGVYVNKESEEKLKKLGVKDSKLLSDINVQKLAAKIKKFPYDIVKISPEKYNELYPKFGSLNKMLAWAHAKVIDNISKKTGCKLSMSDQFSENDLIKEYLLDKTIVHEQKVRAESDIDVAAASILARSEFLKTLRMISYEIGYKLPKGSTDVEKDAKEILKRFGKEILPKIAKMHFKTSSRILKDS